ncbi:MAG: hypothetical protein GEV11_27040 [Streptosporangiales bacterium]|nr:hypothetical protein [Streptosporangiales bacterium]
MVLPPVTGRDHRPQVAAALTLTAGYSWYAAGLRSFTTESLISVLVVGVAAIVLAARHPVRIPAPESLDPRGLIWWMIIVFGFFEWEVAGFAAGSHPWHPTLSVLLDPVLEQRPAKAAAFFAWMLAGWGLLRR